MVEMTSDESSSDEDGIFLDMKARPESVSSVSRDGENVEGTECDDEFDSRVDRCPIGFGVKDGRAFVSSQRKVLNTPLERAKRLPMRAEEEICRVRYMSLKTESRRQREEDLDGEVFYKRICTRERPLEVVSAVARTEIVDEDEPVSMGLRRKSSEDVWFTTLAQVRKMSVVNLGDVDESLRDAKLEEGELVFNVDDGLEALFNKFSEELEEAP